MEVGIEKEYLLHLRTKKLNNCRIKNCLDRGNLLLLHEVIFFRGINELVFAIREITSKSLFKKMHLQTFYQHDDKLHLPRFYLNMLLAFIIVSIDPSKINSSS